METLKGAKIISVFTIFEKYGIENCRIVLVEFCPCDSKDELLKREAYHIKETECVNKRIPITTATEKHEYYKQYRDEHTKNAKYITRTTRIKYRSSKKNTMLIVRKLEVKLTN